MKNQTNKYPFVQMHRNQRGGFIEILVVLIIALVILHVLGIKVSDILAKPWVREFGAYIISMLKLVWQDILEIFAFIKDLAA